MSLSLDLSSVVQFIKRAYYQAYVWFHGYGQDIQDGDAMLVWFGGKQFPLQSEKDNIKN